MVTVQDFLAIQVRSTKKSLRSTLISDRHDLYVIRGRYHPSVHV